MASYMVDASVVLAFVLREGYSEIDEFFAQLTAEDELVGPNLLMAECTAVIHEQIGKARVTAAEALEYLDDVLGLNIKLCHSDEQFRGALDLAGRLRHAKAYDTQYLAAARSEHLELVTIDSGLHQAAINIKHPVRFLR